MFLTLFSLIFIIKSPDWIPTLSAGELGITLSISFDPYPTIEKIRVKAIKANTKFIKAPAKTTAILFKTWTLLKALGSWEFSSSPSMATYPPIGRALRL